MRVCYAYLDVCVCVLLCMHVLSLCMWACLTMTPRIILSCFIPLVYRVRASEHLSQPRAVSLTSQLALNFLFLPSTGGLAYPPGIYVDSGDPNSGPHVYIVSPLTTGVSLGPASFLLRQYHCAIQIDPKLMICDSSCSSISVMHHHTL